MRRFQDEVRSELLKYALLPGLLIAFICTALAALYWERNVVTRTAEEARAAGKIRAWGVSNLDTADMEELWRIDGGTNCAVNQVLYHMGSRGIDYSLLPWMREHNVALMAYCPLAQAGRLGCDLLGSSVLREVAARHGATPAQIALAWAIRDGNTIAIPRTGRKEHAVSNAGADVFDLTAEDCAALDRAFPPPTRKEPLHIE